MSTTPINTLSTETIATVKASLPAFEEKRTQIVLKFYETLFKNYPDFKRQFNMDRHKGGKSQIAGIPAQVASLSSFVVRFAQNIDNIDKFGPAIQNVAHKHVSRAVRADQYSAIAESFLFAIQFILEDSATEQVMKAWGDVFNFLAGTFINAESEIKEALSKRAGFSGFVDMAVTIVRNLENGNREVCLVPKEHPVPPHEAGQFVAVRVQNIQGEDMMCTCKIGEANDDCLCIVVRRSEEDASVFLLQRAVEGSVLQVSMPCGKGR